MANQLGNIFPYWSSSTGSVLKNKLPVELGYIFQYTPSRTWSILENKVPAVGAIRRINSSNISGIVIENVCSLTKVRIYSEIKPEPSGNPLGFAFGISFGLRLYFTEYPSSCHITDTVLGIQCTIIYVKCIRHNTVYTVYSAQYSMYNILDPGNSVESGTTREAERVCQQAHRAE